MLVLVLTVYLCLCLCLCLTCEPAESSCDGDGIWQVGFVVYARVFGSDVDWSAVTSTREKEKLWLICGLGTSKN